MTELKKTLKQVEEKVLFLVRQGRKPSFNYKLLKKNINNSCSLCLSTKQAEELIIKANDFIKANEDFIQDMNKKFTFTLEDSIKQAQKLNSNL